jgi:hypothetical protein
MSSGGFVTAGMFSSGGVWWRGVHALVGLCGGSCFLTDQQPDSKDRERSRVRL